MGAWRALDRQQLRHPCILERRVVIVVQVVQTQHFVATRQQQTYMPMKPTAPVRRIFMVAYMSMS